MTWEIFLGIASLVGFMISVMTIAVRVTKNLTLLEASLKNLALAFQETKDNAKEEHILFRQKIELLEKSALRQQTTQNLERM